MFISKRGQVRSLIMKGFFALFLLSLPVCRSEAAVLTHSHDDSCYSEESFICTNHEIQCEDIQEYGYCRYCEASLWMESGIRYYDVCLDNYIDKVDIACERTCEVCGRTSGFGHKEIRPHEVTRKVLTCGLNDNEGMLELSLAKDITGWTNKDVTLTATVTALNSKATIPSGCLDWGNGYSSTNTKVVSDNGTYSVTLKDAKGETVSERITVSNIDKIPPKLSISKSTEDWCEFGIDVYITAADGESGLSDAPYCYMEQRSNSNSFHVDKNGDYTISVQDRAGNVTTETITINNIGRDPAVVAKEQEEARRLENERLEKEESIKKEEARRAAEERAKEEAKLAAGKAEAEKQKAEVEKERAEAEIEKARAKQLEEERKMLEAKIAEEERLKREEAQPKEEKKAKKSDSTQKGKEDADVAEPSAESGIMIPVIEIVPLNNTKTEMETERIIEKDREPELIIEEPDTAQVETVFEDISDEIYSIEGEFYSEKREDNGNGFFIWKVLLGAGIVLTAIGLFVISKFSYIYMTDHGRKRIISPVKIVSENNKIEVFVDDKKLKSGTRYLIHYSPWVYRQLRGKEVFVMCEYTSKIINADEGYVFLYT